MATFDGMASSAGVLFVVRVVILDGCSGLNSNDAYFP